MLMAVVQSLLVAGYRREQDAVVGHCIYCQAPHDVFGPGDVCTVCRECVLICHLCKAKTVELHCEDHMKVRMRRT